MIHAITPCLWFDGQAAEAALFYTSIFENSEIKTISHYGKEGYDVHGQKEGTVMTVEFTLNGQPFTAMNGGPDFKFNESISFQIFCDTQEEINYYWEKLTENGEKIQCGWLKDQYGLSWQITPRILIKLMSKPDMVNRVTKVLLPMKRIDIEKLEQA